MAMVNTELKVTKEVITMAVTMETTRRAAMITTNIMEERLKPTRTADMDGTRNKQRVTTLDGAENTDTRKVITEVTTKVNTTRRRVLTGAPQITLEDGSSLMAATNCSLTGRQYLQFPIILSCTSWYISFAGVFSTLKKLIALFSEQHFHFKGFKESSLTLSSSCF